MIVLSAQVLLGTPQLLPLSFEKSDTVIIDIDIRGRIAPSNIQSTSTIYVIE